MQLALGVLTALLARSDLVVAKKSVSGLGAQLWFQQWELTHESMTGEILNVMVSTTAIFEDSRAVSNR